MIYSSADEWRASPNKRVALFGMSGLGKTHVSDILRRSRSGWFHYSIDYRIGTRYMGEHIVDNFKTQAMKVPFLRDLLRSDSIYIASNITFANLAPLSTYLGKPGDPDKDGIEFDEYQRRQAQHHVAEVAALHDTAHFIERAKRLYGYDHFVADTGGSICEVVNPDDPDDPVLKALSRNALMVQITGTEDHTEELIRRFEADPKPMCYRPEVLLDYWHSYLAESGVAPDKVDPDAFMTYTYAGAMRHRAPIYGAMADKWGVKVSHKDVAQVRGPDDFVQMIAEAIAQRG